MCLKSNALWQMWSFKVVYLKHHDAIWIHTHTHTNPNTLENLLLGLLNLLRVRTQGRHFNLVTSLFPSPREHLKVRLLLRSSIPPKGVYIFNWYGTPFSLPRDIRCQTIRRWVSSDVGSATPLHRDGEPLRFPLFFYTWRSPSGWRILFKYQLVLLERGDTTAGG